VPRAVGLAVLAAVVVTPLRGQTRDTIADSAAVRLPAIQVIGTVEGLTRVPGSGVVLNSASLQRGRPVTLTDVLRKAPGVNLRDEEGLALRPNIGIRGLSRRRSCSSRTGFPSRWPPTATMPPTIIPRSSGSIGSRC